jgi:uncharacterized protein (TIGR02453 family)
MISQSTIQFLADLKVNNNRDWFNANRNRYESARSEYFAFVNQLIAGIKDFDPSIGTLEAKECTFRINRDIRFSPNKEPYKTNMGAYMARGGRKSPFAGYYFHLEPSSSFVSGGIYMAPPGNMKRIRVEMDTYSEEFLAIVNGKKFKGSFSQFDSESLKRIPQGFSVDSPVAEYLKMKHITPFREMKDNELTSNNLLKSTLEAFSNMQPLVAFLNRALGE